jgi:protein gp37
MGEMTGISWTDHTWNPWHGCIKISPGCKLCYMYREKERYGQNPFIPVRAKTTFEAPMRWKSGRVFTCSWSDFFIAEADAWRDEAWEIIRRTPHLTYQILTKRPERIADHLPGDWGKGWAHVWLGVSAENQSYANERVEQLIEIPAAVRFISAEPLLDEISVKTRWSPFLHWLIAGGESGPGARRSNIRWFDQLRIQCRHAQIPFFLKQFGAKPHSNGIPVEVSGAGSDPSEWPEYLRVQQFPIERLIAA